MSSRRRPDDVPPEAVDSGRGRTRSSTRKQARATEWNPEAIEEIAKRVRIGLPPEVAARLGGVPVEVLSRPDVAERVERARDELQEELLEVLLQGLRSDDRALASETARWVLERRHGFVRQIEIRHLGPDGGPVQLAAVLRAVLAAAEEVVTGDNRDPLDDELERPEASA